jgi:hypothetical protein
LTSAVADGPPTEIEQLTIGADPAAWRSAGFAVEGDATRAGGVNLRFTPGDGILGWRLNRDASEIDGLPLAAPADSPAPVESHPNGVVLIDHLVVLTPDLERTTAALAEIGLERRRVREVETEGGGRLRQGFFRLGEVILEVVAHARVDQGPARFWGITFTIEDIDAAARLLGDRLGSIRDAVQPGRRIATLRREAELGLPVALISPEPPR